MAVITVSREYGSRGEQIAQQVAKELGYSYFDKEILTEVAREINATEEQIRPYDERDEHGFRSFLRKLFVPDFSRLVELPYYYPPGLPLEQALYLDESQPIPDAGEVLAFFRHVVERLWKRGNVIIVGRGSQKILAAKPDTLHVRFIGSIGERSKHVMESEGIPFLEALEKVEMIDKQRTHYLKHHYDADGADVRLYHLVLNTSLMNTEPAIRTIIAAVHHLEKTE